MITEKKKWKGKRYKIMMFKIESNNKSTEYIAGMFYNALNYQGKIHKIDVSIAGVPEMKGGQIIMRSQLTCTKEVPHTKEEYIKMAKVDKNCHLLSIIAAINKEDTRRISVTVVSPTLNVVEATGNPDYENVVAIVNTPLYEPTKDEIDEIIRFIDFMESYEG